MTKENQDFSMISGDDHELTYTITDADGAAKSLTGATSLKWSVFALTDLSTSVLAKTTSSGVSLVNIDDTDDGVKVVLTQADTNDLAGTYKYELEVVDSASKKSTLAKGIATITQDLITT
jgi:hypothetical protein